MPLLQHQIVVIDTHCGESIKTRMKIVCAMERDDGANAVHNGFREWRGESNMGEAVIALGQVQNAALFVLSQMSTEEKPIRNLEETKSITCPRVSF